MADRAEAEGNRSFRVGCAFARNSDSVACKHATCIPEARCESRGFFTVPRRLTEPAAGDGLAAMPFLVISASLNTESNSRVLAESAAEVLRAAGKEVDFLDMRDAPLPMCDGDKAYDDPSLDGLTERIARAEGVLISAPIYNYDLNAAVKNLVELTGKDAWEDQTVGFLCAAGGQASYMSVMAFANSLMLDFRCVIVPRFVYTTGRDFGDDGKPVPGIAKRIEDLAHATVRLSAVAKG